MDFSDEEIRAIILDKLVRKGRWEHSYLPVDSLTGWVGKKIRRDGKRVRKILKELLLQDYLRLWKGGKAVSLNVRKKKEILKVRERLY